jgi:hypothetical protein
MQQSKAYVIRNASRNLKAAIASHRCAVARKAEYAAYRYGSTPYARKVTLAGENFGGRRG